MALDELLVEVFEIVGSGVDVFEGVFEGGSPDVTEGVSVGSGVDLFKFHQHVDVNVQTNLVLSVESLVVEVDYNKIIS